MIVKVRGMQCSRETAHLMESLTGELVEIGRASETARTYYICSRAMTASEEQVVLEWLSLRHNGRLICVEEATYKSGCA